MKAAAQESANLGSPKTRATFFDRCKTSGLWLLNTQLWNNADVLKSTGYTIEMIKEPLYLMTQCLKEGSKPNQLEDFNVELIKGVKNFRTDLEGKAAFPTDGES